MARNSINHLVVRARIARVGLTLTMGCGPSISDVPASGGEGTLAEDGTRGGDDSDHTVSDENTSGGTPTSTGANVEPCARAEQEAATALQLIVVGVEAFFTRGEIPPEGSELAFHRCPHGLSQGYSVAAGPTPPLLIDCNVNESQTCVPVEVPDCGPDSCYELRLWRDDHVWATIGFEMTEPHLLHYAYEGTNFDDGFGSCQFTARAFGDLDADVTVYSTYEISGSLDMGGLVLDEMTVTNPCE